MMKNTLEDYKNAVKAKYEKEKTGAHSDFLLSPSRAKLRNLCFELFKEHQNADDLKVFRSFFKFDFSLECNKKLREETDRFRPIETFFKGETDPADIETINLAAILVDFQPRPFLKFSKKETTYHTFENQNKDIEENLRAPAEIKVIKPDTNFKQNLFNTNNKKSLNKKNVIILTVVMVLGLVFSVKIFFFPKKQCMEWQKDHYVVVECSSETHGFVSIPFDESLKDFRRVWPCDTTTFFKDGKAVLWYCKSEDEIELYNKPGFDPVYDKPLRPITQYMIDKYLR